MQINPKKIIEGKVIIPTEYTKIQQIGIDLTSAEEVEIKHGESYNILLNESIHLPENIFALIYGRSTYNRQGVLIRGSVYDPGFKNQIGCTVYNMSGKALRIEYNARICQIVCFSANSASEYNGQYQG